MQIPDVSTTCHSSLVTVVLGLPTLTVTVFNLASFACYLGVSLARTGLHSSYFYILRHKDYSSSFLVPIREGSDIHLYPKAALVSHRYLHVGRWFILSHDLLWLCPQCLEVAVP